MFEQQERFDPQRDGKVPVARTPLALAIRAPLAFGSMLFSRHPTDALHWMRSMAQRRHPLSYALPWITFDAIRALAPLARPGTRVFEFGSGHSTLWWAEHGAEIHSVEDDESWHGLLTERIAGMPKAHLYFEPGQQGYLSRIDRVGGPFDVVVVDGSHRKDCLAKAIDHVKPGGLLVVDNTDWHWFSDVDDYVPTSWTKRVHAGWAPFIGHRSQTTLWTRSEPAGEERCAT